MTIKTLKKTDLNTKEIEIQISPIDNDTILPNTITNQQPLYRPNKSSPYHHLQPNNIHPLKSIQLPRSSSSSLHLSSTLSVKPHRRRSLRSGSRAAGCSPSGDLAISRSEENETVASSSSSPALTLSRDGESESARRR